MSSHPIDPADAGGLEPPTPDLLAGEYVLGVLDEAQRRDVQARIAGDPTFARLVSDWERSLEPLHAEFAPAEVPASVWPSIRRRLGWEPQPEAPRGLWWSVGFWRAATGFAAAAAVAAIVIGPQWQSPAPPPVAEEQAAKPVTTLAQDDGRPAWLASVDPVRGTVLMVPVPAAADSQGRVPELWLIPPGEAARSLGLVSIDKSHTVAVPAALRQALAAGSTLAVTLEPPGGAPAGVATGPIVAKGQIKQG